MKPLAARARLTQRIRRVAATGDAGSSTTEAVIAAPLLIMFVLLVVLCGRLVSAQMDLNAAASSAARSGSIARTQAAAQAEAQRNALATLAARGVTCRDQNVSVSIGGLQAGAAVTVTVSCRVPLSDLLLLGVPGSKTVSASSTSPIDQWRGGPR